MSLLKIFSSKTPEAHEQRGDELLAADLWGKAKVEYERALEKLEKTKSQNDHLKYRLRGKIHQAKASLAQNHKHNADEMMKAGFYDDARELYLLAQDLAEDEALKEDLAKRLEQLESWQAAPRGS